MNEGSLGAGTMGHPRVTAAISSGLDGNDQVEPHFASLPPMGRAGRLAVRNAPLLGRRGLDLQEWRWHAAQALRTRRLVRSELAHTHADALFVHSHSIALALEHEMLRVPTLLSVDSTVWDFRALGVWRPLRAHARLSMAPSAAMERRVFRAAAAVLPWTGWAARGVRRACPEARVVEHHPGIDLDLFRPAAREPRERLRVLFVASRFDGKGGPDLVAAIGARLGNDVDLDVVTPSPVPEAQGIRVHRGLDNGRLIDLYQQADVFCLPSYADSAPWVVLEAMACGTPVIATTVGGIPDLLDHGAAGELVRPGDRAGLGAALEALLDDEGRRRELAAIGLAHCHSRYDSARQTERLVDLLEGAVSEKLSRSGAGP